MMDNTISAEHACMETGKMALKSNLSQNHQSITMLACAYLKLHAIIGYDLHILYITYIFLLLFRFEVTAYSFGTVYSWIYVNQMSPKCNANSAWNLRGPASGGELFLSFYMPRKRWFFVIILIVSKLK